MTDKSLLSHLRALPNCPVCLKTARKKLFSIKESTVYQCVSCGLRYLDPCLSEEAMASAYASEKNLASVHGFHEGYYDYGDLKKKSKTLADFHRGLALLEKNLEETKEKRVLDVGFGNGFFLAVAKERGWTVRGIDTSAQNLEIARKKFSLDLEQGDLETIPATWPGFHAITFWDVIEHLPDPHAAFQKAAELLVSDGLILIAVPGDGGLINRLARFLYGASGGILKKGIESIYLIEHVSYYGLESLTRLAEMNGFARRDFFFTSTDLAKYRLSLADRLMAQTLLTAGKLFGFENRIVAVFQKTSYNRPS